MPGTLIKVAVGGGHELDRAAREALLSSLPGLEVVPASQKPHVLVWEFTKGKELPSALPDSALLLLTDRIDFENLPGTVSIVTGLFSLDEAPNALGIAIRQMARGEQYLSPSFALALLERRQAGPTQNDELKRKIEQLSEREREILDLLAQGLSNKMIAARLYLSVRTIEGHLVNIYSHLDVHSRTEAMLVAVNVR